ncbi:MAG: hypothetical protein IPG45_33120 [Deltaproteobacteria bacterium]|nr:hypothetical protein [Deltaproteobacteria bacterium]
MGRVPWIWALFPLWMTSACDRPEVRALDLGTPQADAGVTDQGSEDRGSVDAEPELDGSEPDAGFSPDVIPLDADPCGDPGLSGPSAVGMAPEMATVQIIAENDCRRTYRLETTASLREPRRGPIREVNEPADRPRLRTGSPIWDAVYALAVAEAAEASVAQIQDGAFLNGAPFTCAPPGCFETGRLWKWVWTRDTAFAGELGLAALDPARLLSSLELKLSERRGGGDLQIIQDTGTGGSYPISTDRVVWAFAARALLAELEEPLRSTSRDRWLLAMINTAEHDRVVAFDSVRGLYRGESSFLDWREQSYPPWTANDPAQIGASFALSTNVLHLVLLETVSELLLEVQSPEAATWSARAAALRSAIGRHFDNPGGAPAAFLPSTLDPAPVARQDALATALYVLAGLGSDPAGALSAQPFLPFGPPVIWPSQPETAIYHNRAIWPFVTAYLARAGAKVRHDRVVTAAAESLLRGAALQLSHVENLEMTTGRAFFLDGAWSGPVVHSERQLWSVGGFLSLIEQTLLGKETNSAGIRFRPYLPRAWRGQLGDRVLLHQLQFRGRRFDVELLLPGPTPDRAGAYQLGRVLLNGTEVGTDWLSPDQVAGGRVTLELLDVPEPGRPLHRVDTFGAEELYGPKPPTVGAITALPAGLQIPLSHNGADPTRVTYDVLRDGVVVASGLPGHSTEWIDPGTTVVSPSLCYTAQLRYLATGLVSQRAAPSCWWGVAYQRIRTFTADQLTAVGGTLVNNHGRLHYEAWGDPGHSLTLPNFTPDGGGRHLVQLLYGNGSGPINTGITAAVKRVQVVELPAGTMVASGYLPLPQLGVWSEWRNSSFLPVELRADRSYRVVIDDDTRAVNMSAFDHYARYTGGTGGAAPFQRVNIAELKVLRLDP